MADPDLVTRVLLGFIPPSEVETYLKTTMQIDTRGTSLTALLANHAVAYAYAQSLTKHSESAVIELGDHPHLNALRTEPAFQENPKDVVLVKIDVRRLRVPQPRVDWPYVEQLIAQVPDIGDEAALLEFCVPLQKTAPATAARESSFSRNTQTLSFVTDNPDFRIGGPVVDNLGQGRSLLGFWLAPGLRQMSVMDLDGRYVLRNGHHRAVALVARGHVEIPVLLSRSGEQTERPGRFPMAVVLGAEPPRIENFLSPAAVDLPRRRTRTLYTVQVATHAILD